jgi:hypothetical protein
MSIFITDGHNSLMSVIMSFIMSVMSVHYDRPAQPCKLHSNWEFKKIAFGYLKQIMFASLHIYIYSSLCLSKRIWTINSLII